MQFKRLLAKPERKNKRAWKRKLYLEPALLPTAANRSSTVPAGSTP